MSGKPIRPRTIARHDVAEAVGYYSREAGPDVALRFIDALETAFLAISDRPATGSPRYAHELGLPGLRSRGLNRFPYLVFYIERADFIDVWRVLHGRRDIAAWLVVP